MNIQKQSLHEVSLSEAATYCKSPDAFIRIIQDEYRLLGELYTWEKSTPENTERFKNSGWFSIAHEFWLENRKNNL